jgi:hypothetical protein
VLFFVYASYPIQFLTLAEGESVSDLLRRVQRADSVMRAPRHVSQDAPLKTPQPLPSEEVRRTLTELQGSFADMLKDRLTQIEDHEEIVARYVIAQKRKHSSIPSNLQTMIEKLQRFYSRTDVTGADSIRAQLEGEKRDLKKSLSFQESILKKLEFFKG